MAVQFVNANTVQLNTAPVSPQAFTGLTISAGSSIAFVFITYDWPLANVFTVSGVTLGGRTMQSMGTRAFSANTVNIGTEGFFLINPPISASLSVVVTFSTDAAAASYEMYCGCAGFSGNDPTTPFRPGTYQNLGGLSAGTTQSMTIQSSVNDLTVTAMNFGGSPGQTTNQTLDASNTGGGTQLEHDHCTTPASSITHTWTNNAAGAQYAWIGFSIQPPVTTASYNRPAYGSFRRSRFGVTR